LNVNYFFKKRGSQKGFLGNKHAEKGEIFNLLFLLINS